MPCRAGVLTGRLTERVPGHHAGQVFSQVGLQTAGARQLADTVSVYRSTVQTQHSLAA